MSAIDLIFEKISFDGSIFPAWIFVVSPTRRVSSERAVKGKLVCTVLLRCTLTLLFSIRNSK